jgi:hypothetical protein
MLYGKKDQSFNPLVVVGMKRDDEKKIDDMFA